MIRMYYIILLSLFVCSEAWSGEVKQLLSVRGHSSDDFELEYDASGLITHFVYYNCELRLSNVKVSDSSISATVSSRKYENDVKESLLNLSISDNKLSFNQDFSLPGSRTTSLDAARFSNDEFSCGNFYLSCDLSNLVYDNGRNHFVLLGDTIYDCSEKGIFSRHFEKQAQKVQVMAQDGEMRIEVFSLHDYEKTGEFCYVNEKSITFVPMDSFSFPLIRFLNFFLVSSLLTNAEELLPVFLLPSAHREHARNVIVNYDCTNFLEEGDASYSSRNLGDVDGLPWASANGYGIGDSLYLFADIEGNDFCVDFYNGFQSKNRPHLYAQNSRIKELKVTNLDNKKSFLLSLDDTPTAQNISLGQLLPSQGDCVGRFEFEILDVYKGSLYKDVCLQALISDSPRSQSVVVKEEKLSEEQFLTNSKASSGGGQLISNSKILTEEEPSENKVLVEKKTSFTPVFVLAILFALGAILVVVKKKRGTATKSL